MEGVGYVRTVNVGNRLLKSGDFIKRRVHRELEFKVFGLFAVPRPDKITDPGQPHSAISKSRSGNFVRGDG